MTTYTYTTIDPPGSTYTIANSINDEGQIVGFYQDSNASNTAFSIAVASTRRSIPWQH